MSGVVSADTHSIAHTGVNKFLMTREEGDIVAHAVSLAKSLGLAGNKIRKRNYFDIGAFLICFDVSLGYPARADNTDLYFF